MQAGINTCGFIIGHKFQIDFIFAAYGDQK